MKITMLTDRRLRVCLSAAESAARSGDFRRFLASLFEGAQS